MNVNDYVRSRTPGLVRFASVLTGGNGHLAEDVVQEVLLRAARQWDRIGAAESVDAYIRRMVVNEHAVRNVVGLDADIFGVELKANCSCLSSHLSAGALRRVLNMRASLTRAATPAGLACHRCANAGLTQSS